MFVSLQKIPKSRLCTLINTLVLSLALGSNACIAASDYLVNAWTYFEKNDYNSAIIELKNLLQEEPRNAAGRLLIGKIYIQEKDFLAGIKELEKARTLGVSSREWLVPLTRGYLLSGQFDRALDSRNYLNDLTQENQAELLAILGNARLGKNQIIEAKEAFKQALVLHNNVYAILGQVKIATVEERAEDSLRLLDKALLIEPENLEVLTTKARILAAQDQFDAALNVANQALAIDSASDQALLVRSELNIRSGDISAARSDAETVLNSNAHNPQANFILARLQLQAQEYKAAQVSLEKVLRVAPNHTMTYLVLGSVHFSQKNFDQSQFYLEKFTTAQPSHIAATRLLGATYIELGDAKSTIELLAPIDATLDHQDAQLLNVLGQAYLREGSYEKGTEALNRALAIDPDIKGTRIQLALGKLAGGDIDAAVTQLEGAVEQAGSTVQTSVMLILSYMRLNQQEKAVAAIDKAIKQYPKTGAFYYLEGLVMLAQNKTSAARDAYKTANEAQPDYIPGYLALADLDIQNDDFEAAKNNYQKALDIAPNHLKTLLLSARLSEREGNPQSMIRWLLKAKEGNPEAIAPVTGLVNYYLQTNQPDKALAEARQFSTGREKNTASLSLLARVYMAQEEYKKANVYLQEIIVLQPNDISHRMQLVQISSAERKFEDVLGYINDVLGIAPNHIPALVAKIGVLIELKQLDDAETSIAEFSGLYPDSHLNQRLKGDLLLAEKQPEDAIIAYERAFVINKTSYLVNALGHLYSQSNQLQKAIQAVAEYLVEFPDDTNNRLRLAFTYQQLKQNKDAIEQYETVIERENGNHAALNNLAWLYWIEGDERSLDAAQKAYQLVPKDSAIADTYGWIMLHKGDKKDALSIIQTTATRTPANPDIRYHLAKALYENGNKDQARKEVSRLLRDYSGFEEESAAKQLLSTLEAK